ncbi:hypothetical protein HPB49_009582 [Dermacentor silvarum]|uniref:Uncharacterized protein n=1 Tax=Dermacentor silvarum TaxID=543639 RepID=A0ACB8CWK3_DERSI|nr:hypothetical protein HPB49_009582 [Dermacentor silvarum]
MDEDAVVVCSQKGTAKLSCKDGCVYVPDKQLGSRHYWRCVKRGECNTRVITDRPVENTHKVISKRVTHASHAPDICRVTVLRTQERIKAPAAALGEAPVKIVQQVTADVPASSRQHLLSDEALRQIVRRKRKVDCPHEPSAVQELNIEGQFRITIDGREFLRRDCTSAD